MLNVIWNFLWMFFGFVFLVKGADLLVDGSTSIAKKLNVSNLVIGLTVVAFGTTTPELMVNVVSTFNKYTDIAVGNIIGSNLSNILLILGTSAIIYPLAVKRDTISRQIPFLVLVTIIVWFLANDFYPNHGIYTSWISRTDALILLALLILFLYRTFGSYNSRNFDESVPKYKPIKSVVFIFLGIAGLILGGNFVVKNVVIIAEYVGASQEVMGLTIVALGTSLPEYVTAIVASYKKQADIIVGNIVGSSILNLLWVLGVSALISPIRFEQKYNSDLTLLVSVTFLLFIFLFVGKKKVIGRLEGLVFVMIYTAYITVLFLG